MSKKLTSTCTVALDQSEKNCTTVGASSKEPSVQMVFRSLISRLVGANYNNSSPPMQAPLVEVEHEGQVYSLFCRKKQACPAFIELSPREKDIARMIASGFPNKTIAASLEISEFTVSTHLRRIFAKLGVSCRAAMVSKWLESHALCQSGVSAHDLAAARIQPPVKTVFENNHPASGESERRFAEPSVQPQLQRIDRSNLQDLNGPRKSASATSKARLSQSDVIGKPL
jgi:DNA-binding CsgD family transcriptional regulator